MVGFRMLSFELDGPGSNSAFFANDRIFIEWFSLLADEIVSNVSSCINVKHSAYEEVFGSLRAEAEKNITPTYFKHGIIKQLNLMLALRSSRIE